MMRVFLLLACLTFLCGCLTLEHSLRLTEGNSLVAGYVYVYDTDAEPAMAAGLEETGSVAWRFFDEAKVRAALAERKLELVRYRKVAHGGRTTVEISVMTRDFAKSLKEGAFPGMEWTRGKTSVLALQMPEGNLPKETVERLKRICPGFRASLTIAVPGTIVETNGRRLDASTAVWEYAFGDAVVAPRLSWR